MSVRLQRPPSRKREMELEAALKRAVQVLKDWEVMAPMSILGEIEDMHDLDIQALTPHWLIHRNIEADTRQVREAAERVLKGGP